MLDKESIEKKLAEIETALENLAPDNIHFKTVYESQIYILRAILQK